MSVAITNGFNLISNGFEKHQVNLDPNSRSETSTVYRPIDKYTSVLPHLIGSEKWREKWHVGLLDDVAGSEHYAESVCSNATPSDSLKPELDESNLPGSSLMASQDSLAKSVSSIGDQILVINRPRGFFDDIEDEPMLFSQSNPADSTFFRPQAEQRKIFNLFDDEPPSLDPVLQNPVDPSYDNESVDSLPIVATDVNEDVIQKQPVDLFNDNEFDNFIKNIEKKQETSDKKPEVKTPVDKMQQNIKIIEEIKTVKLKKIELNVDKTAQVKVKAIIEAKTSAPEVKKAIPIPQTRPESVAVANRVEPENVKPRPKRITNLFDDDDEDDFFDEILKQKTANRPAEHTVTKITPTKAKISKLFDDDDDSNDNSTEIESPTKLSVNLKHDKKYSSLFDDEQPPPLLPLQLESFVERKSSTNLFDDDEVSVVIERNPEVNNSFVITKSSETTAETIVTLNSVGVTTEPILSTPEAKERIQPVHHIVLEVDTQHENSNMGLRGSKFRPAKSEVQEATAVRTNKVSNQTASKPIKIEQSQSASPKATHSNTSLPFLLSDEPPDDDEPWKADDNFDDHETKPISRSELSQPQSSSSYSSVPLFDDIPPDDDFPPVKPTLPKPKDELETSKTFKAKPDVVDNAPKNFKSKLSMFSKKSDDKPRPLDEITAKKPLPGKLNSKLKINLDALIPGAHLTTPLTKSESTESKNAQSEVILSQKTTTIGVLKVDTNKNSSNLLNNELTKSRVKIRVKRRPSTRRARQMSYQGTLTAHMEADDDIEDDIGEDTEIKKKLACSSQSLSTSTFDDIEDEIESAGTESVEEHHSMTSELTIKMKEKEDKELTLDNSFNTATIEKKVEAPTTVIFAETANSIPKALDIQAPPFKILPEAVITNKIAVFYDDEDDTRMMLEKRNIEKPLEKTLEVKNLDDVEDDIFGKSSGPLTEVPLTFPSSADVESDDDLFGKKQPKVKIEAPPAKVYKIKSASLPKKSKSLFDDDDDDDDLFGSKPKKSSSTLPKKSSKLYESDDEVEASASHVFSKSSSLKSNLFGDENSDDDDLFNSKSFKCKLFV